MHLEGYVVLLAQDLTEASLRQRCRLSWLPFDGGAAFFVTTEHTIEAVRTATSLAVGGDDGLMFLSPAPRGPIARGDQLVIAGGDLLPFS